MQKTTEVVNQLIIFGLTQEEILQGIFITILWTIVISIIIWILNKIRKLVNRGWNKKHYILFVDDNINNFKLIDSLRKHWYLIDTLTDIDDLNGPEISRAKIIFIDYRWVWWSFWNEWWIGLINWLKDKYKNKKKLVLFSATKFSLDQFKTMQNADAQMKKTATTQEFIELINKLS